MTNEQARFAIIAENYEHDIDDGIEPHLIVPDDKRRYSVKAILKEAECQELLAFLKSSEVGPLDADLFSAIAKLRQGLRVMGFDDFQ